LDKQEDAGRDVIESQYVDYSNQVEALITRDYNERDYPGRGIGYSFVPPDKRHE
jgi:hypothetical protein